jgi:uncharacterized protein involved in outer membrane biogenesis
MTIRNKKRFIVAGIVSALLAALVFAIPSLINSNRYRPRIIAYLQEKTGKQVEIRNLSLTLFPVCLHMDDIGVKNPPIFPAGYVVKVARIDAELSFAALLRRQIVINSIVLSDPVIHLTSDPDGPWNFENPQAEISQNTFSPGVISRVEIKRGELIASILLPSDKQGPIFFEAHDVSSVLEQVNLDAIMTPSSSSMDGQGSLKATLLRFGDVEARAVDATVRLQARHVYITGVKAEVYGGNATGELTFNLAGKTGGFQTSLRFSAVNVAQLLAAFPNGGGKMTGSMDGDMQLAGEIEHSLRPLAGIRGTGRITVHEGKLPSIKLNANLMKLMHFNDLGPAQEDSSSFSSISADLHLAGLRISSTLIDLDGYGVDVDGSGSVSVSGSDELNYQGVAKILAKQGFLKNTFARLSGAALKDGQLSFPFQVRGTIESPLFTSGKGD